MLRVEIYLRLLLTFIYLVGMAYRHAPFKKLKKIRTTRPTKPIINANRFINLNANPAFLSLNTVNTAESTVGRVTRYENTRSIKKIITALKNFSMLVIDKIN